MSHAIIVGGTRGLGREVLRVLLAAGHRASVIGRREPAPADRDLPETRFFAVALEQEAAVTAAVEEALAVSGPPSYVVFCQRYRGEGDPWRGEIEVSLVATRLIVDLLSGRFAASGDKGIVMVSSVFGEYVGEGQPLSYHVAKAALNQMGRFYAANLGGKGIRVNTVTAFTFLKEESRKYYLENRALIDLYAEMVPLGRMGTAAEIAQVIGFLCSPASAYVSGQNIYVDGGLSTVWPETLARKLGKV